MRFFKSIGTGFRKYLSVDGIANRSEFWFWMLFAILMLAIATIIDGIFIAGMNGHLPFEGDAGRPLATGTLLVLTVPTITVAIRRLHDIGYSAWWLLVGFTGLGLFVLFYWFVKKGIKKENPYNSQEKAL